MNSLGDMAQGSGSAGPDSWAVSVLVGSRSHCPGSSGQEMTRPTTKGAVTACRLEREAAWKPPRPEGEGEGGGARRGTLLEGASPKLS